MSTLRVAERHSKGLLLCCVDLEGATWCSLGFPPIKSKLVVVVEVGEIEGKGDG